MHLPISIDFYVCQYIVLSATINTISNAQSQRTYRVRRAHSTLILFFFSLLFELYNFSFESPTHFRVFSTFFLSKSNSPFWLMECIGIAKKTQSLFKFIISIGFMGQIAVTIQFYYSVRKKVLTDFLLFVQQKIGKKKNEIYLLFEKKFVLRM